MLYVVVFVIHVLFVFCSFSLTQFLLSFYLFMLFFIFYIYGVFFGGGGVLFFTTMVLAIITIFQTRQLHVVFFSLYKRIVEMWKGKWYFDHEYLPSASEYMLQSGIEFVSTAVFFSRTSKYMSICF